MPKDFTRVNVVEDYVPGYAKPDYHAQIEEWRSYVSGGRWEAAFTIAVASTEEEARKKARALLREWAAELDAPLKENRLKKETT